MNYRVTVLTPTLIGSGEALSPIDYMVWRDQVNVLDQARIFKLLARGPRLDNYLNQIRRADKLDFSSWGGFAQNFAGRRIAFEHTSAVSHWNRMPTDHLFIPEFATSPAGPYLPASALKGALRTALLASRWQSKHLEGLAAKFDEGTLRRTAAEELERQSLGNPGHDLMRAVSLADSAPASRDQFKVFLWRTAKLDNRGGKISWGWKGVNRNTVEPNRLSDAAARFAEMASPGAAFTGRWDELARARSNVNSKSLCAAANAYSMTALTLHEKFASACGLSGVVASVRRLKETIEASQNGSGATGQSCLLNLGWGGGFFGKTGWPHPEDANYRKLLGALPPYSRTISAGLPFPKSRRILFLNDQPATLAGWVKLDIQ